MAPAFDDSSLYSVNDGESDEEMNEGKDDEGLLQSHKYGVFSEDAMTPRHVMNRKIIAMSTVVSEPSLIRSQVLTQDKTAVNDTIDFAGKSLGDNAVQVIAR